MSKYPIIGLAKGDPELIQMSAEARLSKLEKDFVADLEFFIEEKMATVKKRYGLFWRKSRFITREEVKKDFYHTLLSAQIEFERKQERILDLYRSAKVAVREEAKEFYYDPLILA